MKLIFENWRRYTATLLNEDLLIESLAQAEDSVIKRATKLIKGWAYNIDKTAYDYIEQKAKKDLEDEWGADSFDQIKDYAFSWSIGGHLIFAIIKNMLIPNDITETQKKVAFLWTYRMLTEEKVVYLDTFFAILYLFIMKKYQKGITSMPVIKLVDGGSEEYMAFVMYDLRRMERDIYLYYVRGESYSVPKRNLVERFFQWNRFIRDGKRDLNSISDYDELYEVVKEAEPLYKEWQAKQENKDAEKGKELLLDDDRWQIIAIHNKGAACQLGKGTHWCTAAPGLEYFHHYYQPEDPLFYILDKSDGQRYQFHFGSEQYMNESDEGIRYDNPALFYQIISALDKVVPAKYQFVRNKIDKINLGKKNPYVDPNTGERW
jgi:hypothetical protein